jgi:acetyl-CoA carboxylase biotin carboxyl carrier protein
MNLTDADVQEIIRLLDDSGYDELEIETADFRLVLQRSEDRKGWSRQRETLARPHRVDTHGGNDASVGSAATKHDPTSPGASAAFVVGKADHGLNDGLWAIRSPMVGTFYRAPRPGADPFVLPGSRVGPDTVVAIIEVMKLMNSVAAGMDGEVMEIVVEDGQLIEKGQCLMRVRPLDHLDGQAG